MADVIIKRRQKKSREIFVEERVAKGYNQKSNEKLLTIISILTELLKEHSREGLLITEIAEKIGRTRQTVNNTIYELESELGVVEKRGEKWFANHETGMFYESLMEKELGFNTFKPVQIKTFKNETIRIGNQNISATGSIWTNQFTKETDPNKIISSGMADLIILKPAGAQPII
ncbi:MAG: HTH domain-containing protein [Candidatus Pacearchaeota archaeon]|jgi:hypothetical protein